METLVVNIIEAYNVSNNKVDTLSHAMQEVRLCISEKVKLIFWGTCWKEIFG